jgi:hypothetical protein
MKIEVEFLDNIKTVGKMEASVKFGENTYMACINISTYELGMIPKENRENYLQNKVVHLLYQVISNSVRSEISFT